MNLRLLQLGDSALPVGSFSHSWGLEAAINRGQVRDASELEDWVRCWLRYAVAPLEGVVVASACRAALRQDWAAIRNSHELLDASITPPTLRQASRDTGGQLLALAENWSWAAASAMNLRRVANEGTVTATWHHASVFGCLAAAGGADQTDALMVYLHQAALGVVGAGVRAVPVGHTHGQQIVARLHDDIRGLAATTACDLDAAGSLCPAYEELCHAQSGLYTRLFRS